METRKLYLLLMLAAVFAGCSAGYDFNAPAGEQTEVVFVALVSPELQIGRAMNESRIWGGKSIVYDEQGKLIQSSSTADASLSMISFTTNSKSKYRLMATVNSPNSIIDNHADSLHNQWWDYQAVIQNGRMPMTYYAGDVSIPYNYGVRYYYYFTVKRVLAKVAINVNVATHAGDIALRSLDICNVPDKVKVFDTEPTRSVELTYEELSVSDAVIAENTITATVYLPENIRGVNPAITTPEEKHAENAPSNATYIRIGALVSGQPVNYHIYIGENKTEDFNLRRNTFHTYNITITGADPNDRRIEFTFDND